MNDFTKDELNDICAAVYHCYKQGVDLPSDTSYERFSYNLMKKVQNMIATYCEHSFRMFPVKGFPLERDYRCVKCGVVCEC